jgi:hypothetical protein
VKRQRKFKQIRFPDHTGCLQGGPVDQTFDTFNRWFEYRFHSMLVDLCNEPVARDEI